MNGQNLNVNVISNTILATLISDTNTFLNTIQFTNIISTQLAVVGTAAAPRYTITVIYKA
jgi:hypothetical protein